MNPCKNRHGLPITIAMQSVSVLVFKPCYNETIITVYYHQEEITK